MRYLSADQEPAATGNAAAAAFEFSGQPAVAVAYRIADWAVEILGPLMWAALIVLFLVAQFTAT